MTSATTLLMSGGSCWRSRNGATERSWQTARQVLHLVLACLWPHCDLASTKYSTAASQAHSKPPGSPAETFMAGMLLRVVDIWQEGAGQLPGSLLWQTCLNRQTGDGAAEQHQSTAGHWPAERQPGCLLHTHKGQDTQEVADCPASLTGWLGVVLTARSYRCTQVLAGLARLHLRHEGSSGGIAGGMWPVHPLHLCHSKCWWPLCASSVQYSHSLSSASAALTAGALPCRSSWIGQRLPHRSC